MTSIDQPLPGAHVLEPRVLGDERGDFVKTFHAGVFVALGLEFQPVEEFYSTSRRGVLRGMHFQRPPHDHAKLVYCIQGAVLDVLLDLRRSRPTYGQAASVHLSRENHRLLYVPAGLAHGFLALTDDAVMVYKTTTVHAPSHDAGIRWDGFGFDWKLTAAPVLSARDRGFPVLSEFDSPFA
jgi:dTDP-4-dehydrorhamnose 3,5-epimerase/CDP-3, 6-dideoxy-D-glycero-D-glycero-4-hexulose-5-epimerase